MQLIKPFLSLLTLVSAAVGVVIPTDVEDGIYLLRRDGSGPQKLDSVLNFTKASNFRLTRSLPLDNSHHPRDLQRRNLWGSTDRIFPENQRANYDKCTTAWKNWLLYSGSQLPGNTIYTVVVGGASLTGCNYSGGKFKFNVGLDMRNKC